MAAETNDMQAIEKISAVVGESQVKIILSNQCIKGSYCFSSFLDVINVIGFVFIFVPTSDFYGSYT